MNRDQIADAMDAERAQIAQQIHDALLPLIFAASAAVQRQIDEFDQAPQQPIEDPERLRQALGWLQDALQIGRQILTHTHPPELADHSWDSAAKQTIQQCTPTDGNHPPPRIQWQIDSPCRTLGVASAGACYRVVVEAIRNAIRHGQASRITVTGTSQDNDVVVSIIDNGRGFDPSRVPEDRFGIRSMTGRAESVGGKLQLESQPGGPTTVRLSVPAGD